MMKEYNLIIKAILGTETKFLKYRKVTNTHKLFNYLKSKGYEIDYVNIYDNKTKLKIDSYAYKERHC